jgi:hypothetical protein
MDHMGEGGGMRKDRQKKVGKKWRNYGMTEKNEKYLS